MSWLFSQALVEAYSEATCLDGEPFAPSNGENTQQAYCSPDKMTEFSRLSRFGMTFKPLTEDHGEALLMSYLAAFHAKTLVPQGVPESMALEAACGNTWQELSVRFDLNASSWKTAHCLWEEALPWFSVILPRWGMTRNGSVYQHQTAERPISETVSGLLPTPLASNTKANHMRSNGRPPRSYWPTPTVCGNYNRKGVSKTSGDGLATAVRTWPTPVATMSKGSSPASLTRKSGRDRSNDRLDHAVMAAEGGQLNPTWVEWLMGWPLGWTDLKPLEMGKFHEWQQQHSISCQTK